MGSLFHKRIHNMKTYFIRGTTIAYKAKQGKQKQKTAPATGLSF